MFTKKLIHDNKMGVAWKTPPKKIIKGSMRTACQSSTRCENKNVWKSSICIELEPLFYYLVFANKLNLSNEKD